jgi:hypothetical protein
MLLGAIQDLTIKKMTKIQNFGFLSDIFKVARCVLVEIMKNIKAATQLRNY